MKKRMEKSVLGRKTKRLWIRSYRKGDFPAWRESAGESATAQAFDLIRNLQAGINSTGTMCHLGAFERESGALIGMVIFHAIERENIPRGELTLWIPTLQAKKKYEKELLEAALEIGFGPLALAEIIVTTHEKGKRPYGPGTQP